MISDIYNRPMFQTPERRAGGGIMAGVAPINQFMGPMRLADGDFIDMDAIKTGTSKWWDESGINPDHWEFADLPSISLEEGADKPIRINVPTGEGTFLSYDKTEEGSGLNARDITDILIFDPEDPVDTAIAAAAAAMIVFPPAEIAVGLAKLGYTGVKATRAIARATGLQKKLFPDGKLIGSSVDKLSKGLGDAAKWWDKNSPFLGKRWSATDETGGLSNFLFRNRIAPSKVPDTVWDTVKGRTAQYQTNRILGEAGELIDENVDFSMIPSAQASEPGNILTEEVIQELEKDNTPQEDAGGIETLITESGVERGGTPLRPEYFEEEKIEEGGITSLPTSIWQARDKNVKSPTFMRDGVPKAAVTVEDVEESGLGSLQNYLNAMDFDEDLGQYIKRVEAENKASGGIMRLAQGSGKTGVIIKGLDELAELGKQILKAAKNSDLDELAKLERKADGITDPVARKAIQNSINKARDQATVQGSTPFRVAGDAPGSKPPVPPVKSTSSTTRQATKEDLGIGKYDTVGTVAKSADALPPTGRGGLWDLAKKHWGKTAIAGGAAGLYGYDWLTGDDEKPDPTVVTTPGGTGPASGVVEETEEARLKRLKEEERLRLANRGLGERTTDFMSSALKQLLPANLREMYASDPKRAMFLAGQLMKTTPGWTPTNTWTTLTEADATFDKLEQDALAKQPELFQTYELLVGEQERLLGKPLDSDQKEIFLYSLFDAAQSDDRLQSIFKAMGDNPEWKADPEIRAKLMTTINKILSEQNLSGKWRAAQT